MALGEVYDLGNVLTTGEQIKSSRQRRNFLANQERRAQQTFDAGMEDREIKRQMQNLDLLYRAASEVEVNPGSIQVWAPQLQRSGIELPYGELGSMQPEELSARAGELRQQLEPAYQKIHGAAAKAPGKLYQIQTPSGVQWVERSSAVGQMAPEKKPLAQVTVNQGNKSMANKVGDIMKGERTKASGAIKMFRQSNEILNTLDQGSVIVGPTATIRLKGAQIANMLGFTGSGALTRTRSLIKSLANMAVEARKELAGQGSVTENEAEAVIKAMSGEVDDLTIDEIKLLANLNKKAANFTAMQYQEMLSGTEQTAPELMPFYQLRGLDEVIEYQPEEQQPISADQLSDDELLRMLNE